MYLQNCLIQIENFYNSTWLRPFSMNPVRALQRFSVPASQCLSFPFSQCPRFPASQCRNVPVSQPSVLPMSQCANVPFSQYSNIQMPHCPNTHKTDGQHGKTHVFYNTADGTKIIRMNRRAGKDMSTGKLQDYPNPCTRKKSQGFGMAQKSFELTGAVEWIWALGTGKLKQILIQRMNLRALDWFRNH